MAPVPEKADSVYDFIYVDARRIAVLLSQLAEDGTSGVLTELKHETKTGSTTSGGLSVHVAKVDAGDTESTGLTRTFDPQWLVPPLFLDLAGGAINRNISNAVLGELVLSKGSLELKELRTLVSVLSLPNLKSRLANKMSMEVDKEMLSLVGVEDNKPPTNAQKVAARQAMLELVLGILEKMPDRSQITLQSGDHKIWSVLREDGLIISHEELALTHGTSVPGEWVIVGLLDGMPDKEEQPTEEVSPDAAQGFQNSARAFAGLARKLVGRPPDAYAVTPLMIFREVKPG